MKLILSFLFVFYFGNLFAQIPNSTFLIPKNYKGLIYIFLKRPNADTLPIMDSSQVYRIPSDGILITKSNSIDYSVTSFYYVDSLGNKQEISKLCNQRPKDECTTKVKIEGGSYEYHQSKKDKAPLQFMLLSITDRATINLVKSKAYNKKMSLKISKKLKREFYFEYNPLTL